MVKGRQYKFCRLILNVSIDQSLHIHTYIDIWGSNDQLSAQRFMFFYGIDKARISTNIHIQKYILANYESMSIYRF